MNIANFAGKAIGLVWFGMTTVSFTVGATSPVGAATAINLKTNKKIDKGFARLFEDLWPEAKALGISRATYIKVLHFLGAPDRSLGGLRRTPPASFKPTTPPPAKAAKRRRKRDPLKLPGKCYKPAQREFLRPANYFPETGRFGLAAVVKRGQQKWAEHSGALKYVHDKYKIHPSIILAIWGRETNFGRNLGRKNVLRTLATRAAYAKSPWRRTFNRNHLLAALKMVDEGHVTMKDFKGSWLGATGHTQFMPQEFYRYAVNGDEDASKIDIWNSLRDAFASTANFLLSKGADYKNGKVWEPGVPWGYEVTLPKGFDCALESRSNKKTIATWVRDYGVRRAGGKGKTFPKEHLQKLAYVILPAGTKGPAFLALNNFEVFRHYNKSDLYALYLGHVADRIKCDRPGRKCRFHTRWAPKERNFTITPKNLCGLQILLREQGFYDDKIDGLFGQGTRIAIGRYEKQAGLPQTCYPSRAIYKKLCKSQPKACAKLRRQGAVP